MGDVTWSEGDWRRHHEGGGIDAGPKGSVWFLSGWGVGVGVKGWEAENHQAGFEVVEFSIGLNQCGRIMGDRARKGCLGLIVERLKFHKRGLGFHSSGATEGAGWKVDKSEGHFQVSAQVLCRWTRARGTRGPPHLVR